MLDLMNTNLKSPAFNSNTGPGPTTLKSGDLFSGYYGVVSHNEFISDVDLMVYVGRPTGSIRVLYPDWLKFSHNEKTLFVAKVPIMYNVIWNNLNSLGVVQGETKLIHGELEYSIRMLYGSDGISYHNSGGEWNDLIYKISINDPTEAFWEQFTDEELGIGGALLGRATFCRDINIGTTGALTRGELGLTSIAAKLADTANSRFGWRPVLELIG